MEQRQIGSGGEAIYGRKQGMYYGAYNDNMNSSFVNFGKRDSSTANGARRKEGNSKNSFGESTGFGFQAK